MSIRSVIVGTSFGLVSGVITTLGLIVGLHAGTESLGAVVGGIVTIALADGLSDALGLHVSQESSAIYSDREVWIVTLVTFVIKFFTALSFLIPILLLPWEQAILTSIAWGLLIIVLVSYQLARRQGKSPFKVSMEHVLTTGAVIFASNAVGEWVHGFNLG